MERNLSAVVLAGVHDWGSCPLHRVTVRPLVPVANRPLIDYALAAAESAGAGHVVICANGSGAPVRGVIGDATPGGTPISYHEDTMPRGPAGCVKDAASIGGSAAGDILIIEASVIPGFDVSEVVAAHRNSGASLTIATHSLGEADAQQPVGVYVISQQAVEHIGGTGYQDIKEGAIPALHKAGLRVATYPVACRSARLLGLGAYFFMNEWMLKRCLSDERAPDGYTLNDAALIHRDAQVDVTARLIGPVMVGPGAVIGEGVVIVGPTVVGAGVQIEAGAVVTRSVVWDGARLGRGSVVDRSVVTDHAQVPGGVRLYDEVWVAGRKTRRTADCQALKRTSMVAARPTTSAA